MKTMSPGEYARHKGISPQAVYKKIEKGQVKTITVKVDRVRVVVDDEDIEE